jgi:hypothetical protein
MEEVRMAGHRDPRSEAEKARADLKRNAELDSSTIPMSPLTRQPSVTPETFGEHGAKAQALSGSDQGLEAGGSRPVGQSGASESIVEADQVTTGRDNTKPAANRGAGDALSKRKD